PATAGLHHTGQHTRWRITLFPSTFRRTTMSKLNRKRRSKSNRSPNNAQPCAGCGCALDPHDARHLDHAPPPTLEELAELAPSMSQEGLLDIASERREAGIHIEGLHEAILKLSSGDLVKLCFRVTARKPLWLPTEMRPLLKDLNSEHLWVKVLHSC